MQQIKVGSSNFRTEIEGYLSSAELTFGKLNEDLRNILSQVANKFSENDGRNARVEGGVRSANRENRITKQVLEHERRDREIEKYEVSKQISAMRIAIDQQQKLLANNQQTFKDELMQAVTKRVECGVPSEIKNEPPGLYRGGDDRGLGA